jgi:hypothetical protein
MSRPAQPHCRGAICFGAIWLLTGGASAADIVSSEYFPTEPGVSTPFAGFDVFSGPITATLSASALQPIHGVATTRFDVTSSAPGFPGERWFYSATPAAGVRVHRLEYTLDGLEFEQWVAPMTVLPPTIAVGGVYPFAGSYTGEYREAPEDIPFTWTGSETGSATVLGWETLETAYGRIRALRVRVQSSSNETIFFEGEEVGAGASTEVTDWWLARGLGVVRLDRFVQEFIDGELVEESDFDVVVSQDGEEATTDTDGDGLPDSWETSGVPVLGLTTRYLLPGADPNRKDLYLEVDAMAGRAPGNAALTDVRDAFANAPVSNPNGAPDGVALHIIGGLGLIDDATIPLETWAAAGFDDLYATKEAWFGTVNERFATHGLRRLVAKDKAYRYVVFAHAQGADSTSGKGELPGDDLMVTLGLWATPGGTAQQQSATLLHELGHTLGLGHGGGQIANEFNWKPNYYSVMNYWWQFPRPGQPVWRLDYSEHALPALDEAALVEADGLGAPDGEYPGVVATFSVNTTGFEQASMEGATPATAADWDDDGMTDAGAVRVDINIDPRTNDGSHPDQILTGHDDWANLAYGFRDAAGYLEPYAGLDDPQELTEEDVLLLAALPTGGCPGDANGDGVVDGADLGALLAAWGAGAPPALDFDGDGAVTGADLGALLGLWGACAPG